jgi:hypothetical protein
MFEFGGGFVAGAARSVFDHVVLLLLFVTSLGGILVEQALSLGVIARPARSAAGIGVGNEVVVRKVGAEADRRRSGTLESGAIVTAVTGPNAALGTAGSRAGADGRASRRPEIAGSRHVGGRWGARAASNGSEREGNDQTTTTTHGEPPRGETPLERPPFYHGGSL